jgi:hypothetical protein
MFFLLISKSNGVGIIGKCGPSWARTLLFTYDSKERTSSYFVLRFYDIVLNNSQQSVFYLTDGWPLMTPIYPNDL